MRTYYNTIDELKEDYENSDMTQEELGKIINDNSRLLEREIYNKLDGCYSYDKAQILVSIWKKNESEKYEIW